MIEITHNTEDNIVRIWKDGIFKYSDATNVLQRLKASFDDFDTLYVLEDSRTTKYKIGFDEMPKLLKEVKMHMGGRKEVRHADLVRTPLETAISLIYAKLALPVKNYNYKAFTTEAAALVWLKKGGYYDR